MMTEAAVGSLVVAGIYLTARVASFIFGELTEEERQKQDAIRQKINNSRQLKVPHKLICRQFRMQHAEKDRHTRYTIMRSCGNGRSICAGRSHRGSKSRTC